MCWFCLSPELDWEDLSLSRLFFTWRQVWFLWILGEHGFSTSKIIHLQHPENEHDWLENPLFYNGRYIFKWWMFHCYVSFAKTPWKLSWEKPFKNLGQLIREFFVWVRDRIFQTTSSLTIGKMSFSDTSIRASFMKFDHVALPIIGGRTTIKTVQIFDGWLISGPWWPTLSFNLQSSYFANGRRGVFLGRFVKSWTSSQTN